MTHTKDVKFFSAFAFLAFFATNFSSARAEDKQVSPAFSTDEAWEKIPITVDVSDATAKTVLTELADRAGLGLAVTASPEDLERTLTVRVKNRPAGEVFEIIRSGLPKLNLEIKNSVLLASSKAAAPASLKTEPSKENHESSDKRHKRRREKKKDRVEFGHNIVIEENEHYYRAAAVGGNITIFGEVDKDAVCVGGTLTVKSGARVRGSAVCVGGSVIIEPGAEVGDDAVSVGGSVTLSDDATLGGNHVSIGIPLPPMVGAAGVVSGFVLLHIVGAIFRSVMLLAAMFLLLWLVPRNIDGVGGYISKKPGISVLSGLLLFVAVVPLLAVLTVSIIGIPLIPIAGVILAALVVLGLTAVLAEIGKKMPFPKSKELSFKTVLVGFIVFFIINIIPIIGGIFCLFCTLLGAGAAFQSRFGRRPVA